MANSELSKLKILFIYDYFKNRVSAEGGKEAVSVSELISKRIRALHLSANQSMLISARSTNMCRNPDRQMTVTGSIRKARNTGDPSLRTRSL